MNDINKSTSECFGEKRTNERTVLILIGKKIHRNSEFFDKTNLFTISMNKVIQICIEHVKPIPRGTIQSTVGIWYIVEKQGSRQVYTGYPVPF